MQAYCVVCRQPSKTRYYTQYLTSLFIIYNIFIFQYLPSICPDICISKHGARSEKLQGIAETILFRSLYFNTVKVAPSICISFNCVERDPNERDNTVEVPLANTVHLFLTVAK